MERLEFERVVSTKIRSNLNEDFLNIISIPCFHNINEYTEYIKERVFNMFNNKDDDKKTIFIATGNNSKIQDFKLYLGDEFNLKSPKTFNIKINVPEGINSIEYNAIAKARAYAYKTGLVSIGDDTGFFIEELNGEPGVALRRWGGELPEETTNAEFWSYFQEKIKNLNNYKCYFKQCVAIVSPTGKMKLVYNINHGSLNKEKLKLPYNGTDYPLAAAFESENREKTWDEMTDKEKKDFDKAFIDELLKAIDQVIEK